MWKMKLGICVTSAEDDYARVFEHTDGNQYLPEDSTLTAKNRFKYSDTASVDIFELHAIETQHYSASVVMLRKDSEPVKIKLRRDGWFTAIHIVIPTKEWVDNERSKPGTIMNTYDKVYFTDGEVIYTYVKGVTERSNLKALLNEELTNTTISRTESDYVSIAQLNQQLKEAYIGLFRNRLYNGGCHTNACIANRLLTAINLIKHYVRHGQLAEAARIIEKVNYFNIPKPNNSKKDIKRYNDCGCS